VQTNTEDDDVIIVTESFIRQLKNEVEIIKTESQGSMLVLLILNYILVINSCKFHNQFFLSFTVLSSLKL